MRTFVAAMGGVGLILSSLFAAGSGAPARAAELPSYFKEIVGTQTASPAQIGTKDVLQLNTTMFELYGDAAKIFKRNILAEHPLILGLFSGAGGRFILYRPGMARSTRRKCRSSINCSNRSAIAPWLWPKWSFPI